MCVPVSSGGKGVILGYSLANISREIFKKGVFLLRNPQMLVFLWEIFLGRGKMQEGLGGEGEFISRHKGIQFCKWGGDGIQTLVIIDYMSRYTRITWTLFG
jgi:hypothetical protein